MKTKLSCRLANDAFEVNKNTFIQKMNAPLSHLSINSAGFSMVNELLRLLVTIILIHLHPRYEASLPKTDCMGFCTNFIFECQYLPISYKYIYLYITLNLSILSAGGFLNP